MKTLKEWGFKEMHKGNKVCRIESQQLAGQMTDKKVGLRHCSLG